MKMTREAGSQPTAGVPSFGENGYCKEEQSHLQGQLAKKLGPNLISQRPSTTEGQRIAFVETWKLIALANELFGFNGWSNSITSQSIDFVDESDGQYYAGVNACVRVTLRDGTYHEELGYGMAEGLPSKGASLEKARKEAVADGLKRCLRNFGNALGNCLGDKHYLQWVVNQSDAHSSSPASSSSDSLMSELITASQMMPPTNENSAASVTTTVLDMQQQQFLQLQLQHQNSLTCLQPAARLGQATFSPQHQQQIPLLTPFALAAATGGGVAAGGLATSSAQQLFLVRPVAAQTSGLAPASGLLPGNNFTGQLQQRPPSHQVQRLHGIFNNVTKMNSTACSGASSAQGSLPITIQSGNSSSSGVHTVMTNNFIQPLMANHVQGGMLSLHTALSNSQTFMNNLQNGLACGVQNNLQNSGQSSITNLMVQNCITNRNAKSVPSSVSTSSVVNSPPSSSCKNTFAKPGPLSKTNKSAVKAVAQHPARDIAPKSSTASHSSGIKGSGANAADVTCNTQSCMSRLRVVMPPLEKPVQTSTTSTIKSTRGDRGKGRKRSRTQSNLSEIFSCNLEPRQKKSSIPLVTIHSQLDPKDDVIDVKQETLDEDESPYFHNTEPLKNFEVGMNSYPLRSREASPKVKKDHAASFIQITKETMQKEPYSRATSSKELNRSVVADAMSKLYKEGANEQEMDFDRHSDTLRKEVEGKSLVRVQTKPIVASPVLVGCSARKELQNKKLFKTQSRETEARPMLVDSSLRKDVGKNMLSKTLDKISVASPTLVDSSLLEGVGKYMPSCKTQDKVSAANLVPVDSNLRKDVDNLLSKTPDKAMVASSVFVDSGRSPRKLTVHIPVLSVHQDNITLDDTVILDDDRLIDLPDNTSHTVESIISSTSIQTADSEGIVNIPDEEYLDSVDIHVSKKVSLRSVGSIPNSGKECSTKLPFKLRKGYASKPEKECTNTSRSNQVEEKTISKDFITLNTEVEESCGMPTNLLLSDNTNGESKAKKSLRQHNLPTQIGKACRTLMKKEYPTLECSNMFQGNSPKVESTSESKSKVSSILKRVNYEKTKDPHLGADVSIQFENSLRGEISRLKKPDPGSHFETRPVQEECLKTSLKMSGRDSGVGVEDSDKVTLNDDELPKSDENSNNPPSEKTSLIVTNEQVNYPDSKTDNMNTSNIFQGASEPTIADAVPALVEKPASLSMEYKDLFNQSNSPLSEDENTFTGFTDDMCKKTSPQTLIDLEMHIKQQKPTGDESEKEQQRKAMKLDRQRHFRHNLRIKFKGSGGGRAFTKMTETAAGCGRRTSGATTPKLANGHRLEEATPASPNRDDLEGPDGVDGLDQFATSLGLTPRRLLSDSPVTPPSAFLLEKRSSNTSRQQQGKSTSASLLPFSNILMKALQQRTLSPSPPGGASCSTSYTEPLSDVSVDSSSKPSKAVNDRFDADDEAMTFMDDIEKAATMPATKERVCEAATIPTLKEKKISVSTSAIALSLSPSFQGHDVSFKPSSPIITTSISTDSRIASFSKGNFDNSSSKPSNSISLDHATAVRESAHRAQNGSIELKTKVSDDCVSPVTSKDGVTQNSKGSSSSSRCASPCVNSVSFKLSELPTLSDVRLTSNDSCDEESVGSRVRGKTAADCLERTHLPSSVDSGVVGSEQDVKEPSGSDKHEPVKEVQKTNTDDVALRNGNT